MVQNLVLLLISGRHDIPLAICTPGQPEAKSVIFHVLYPKDID